MSIDEDINEEIKDEIIGVIDKLQKVLSKVKIDLENNVESKKILIDFIDIENAYDDYLDESGLIESIIEEAEENGE